jgi:hypothetical protein
VLHLKHYGLSVWLLLLANIAASYDIALAGFVRDARLTELSAAASVSYRRNELWAINDGGNGNILFRISQKGEVLQSVSLAEFPNIDVEDMARFTQNKRQYLVIADFGDNGAVREELGLYVYREPKQTDANLALEWKVRYRYPDRRFDCESIFISDGYAYLITKRTSPAQLFRVPLAKARSDEVRIAEALGPVLGLRGASAESDDAVSPNQTTYADQPTGAAKRCDGLEFVLLTYGALYRFPRLPNQSWQAAVASNRKPTQILLPPTLQAEAVAYSKNCKDVIVLSEKTPSPIWRIRLDEETHP